jgi:hypothetical protein
MSWLKNEKYKIKAAFVKRMMNFKLPFPRRCPGVIKMKRNRRDDLKLKAKPTQTGLEFISNGMLK